MRKKKPVFRTWACRCGNTFSVLEVDPNKHLLEDRIKCPTIRCRFYLTRNDGLSPGTVVQALVLYQSFCGLGDEDQRHCSPADVRKMVLGKKVVAVSIEPASDKRRSLISSLTLEDGKTLHLAPSTKGVTIYKVTHG